MSHDAEGRISKKATFMPSEASTVKRALKGGCSPQPLNFFALNKKPSARAGLKSGVQGGRKCITGNMILPQQSEANMNVV